MAQVRSHIYICDNCDNKSEDMKFSDRLPYNWSVVVISSKKGSFFGEEITLCSSCNGQSSREWKEVQRKTSLDIIGRIFKIAFSRRKKDEEK